MKDNNIDFNRYIKKSSAVVSPFIYNVPSISEISIKTFALLLIQIILLFVTKSYEALSVIGFSFLGSVCAVVICYFAKKETIHTLFSTLVQGLILGMLLPQNYPVVTVFFLSFCVFFLSDFFVFKNINNWINIIVLSVIVAWTVGKNFFPQFLITSDLLPLKNASSYLIQNGVFPIYNFDVTITDFLNKMIFNPIKVTLPTGYISLLWDTQSIIPAFRFNILTIIASIIIFSDNMNYGIIPCFFIVVYALLVRLFGTMIFGGIFNQGDILLAILTSGTLFCAVFVLQWFGTTPVTIIGKICYGIISGIFAFLIVGCGTSPIGMVYTVLICNILNMVIRVVEESVNLKRTEKIVNKSLEKNVPGENE